MGKVVCVTGASGYVASWLVKFLLHRGYTVKGTVRNLNDPDRVDHLKGLKGLRKDYSCSKPICSKMDLSIPSWTLRWRLSHSISRFTFHYRPTELIEPAVKGTLNVLKSCSKVASVKRVGVTSSIAAVNCNRKDQGPNAVVDETWFSDSDFCKETEKWYWLAKTLAEEAAWKYAQEHGMNLVALNPGFVVGPLLHPTLNTSSHLILHILRGNEVFPVRVSVLASDWTFGRSSITAQQILQKL
ncbi:Cinnamoyl-CoA reductase 1 [Sesamum angolense]|uniref:Dihydroflavonol 4-reductase n=1 Tax=Sesamum angolense TaxID=2727404 RepID=A0AAE2C2E8_9LAMI|nr:Cinnamoyl-CoA reductase 1 [Sesamum angolense]